MLPNPHHRNGRLVLAATRGDGREGEDVTHNVMTRGAVQGLPVTMPATAGDSALPEEFEVRGEVYIRLSDFDKVGGYAFKLQQQTRSHRGWSTGISPRDSKL